MDLIGFEPTNLKVPEFNQFKNRSIIEFSQHASSAVLGYPKQ